jgi:hypothetical protein
MPYCGGVRGALRGAAGMFSSYVIYDPATDNSVLICKLSYIAAGLFGALYVLVKARGGRFAVALALHLLVLLGLGALLFASSILPAQQQLIVLAIATPAALVFLSLRMVALVKSSYRRRHWIVQQGD